MPNEQFAILIQCLLLLGAAIVAGIAGFAYVKTNGEAGGFVCLIFVIVMLSLGGDIVNATEMLRSQ